MQRRVQPVHRHQDGAVGEPAAEHGAAIGIHPDLHAVAAPLELDPVRLPRRAREQDGARLRAGESRDRARRRRRRARRSTRAGSTAGGRPSRAASSVVAVHQDRAAEAQDQDDGAGEEPDPAVHPDHGGPHGVRAYAAAPAAVNAVYDPCHGNIASSARRRWKSRRSVSAACPCPVSTGRRTTRPRSPSSSTRWTAASPTSIPRTCTAGGRTRRSSPAPSAAGGPGW